MSIEVIKVNEHFGIWDGYNCKFVDPEEWQFNEKRIKEYLKENPFPKDTEYSERDFLHDILKSSGSYIIPTTTRETAEFIVELIQAVI